MRMPRDLLSTIEEITAGDRLLDKTAIFEAGVKMLLETADKAGGDRNAVVRRLALSMLS